MFSDDQLLPISALQHLLYCERQCALIHLEQVWAENRFTVEGRHLHTKADSGKSEKRPGVATGRAVSICSHSLGLIGKADVIEIRVDSSLPTADLPPTVVPVEYKRGKPKSHNADRVQLCAQALCLEEMLGVTVEAGALFYGRTRRRTEVVFDENLRALTRRTIERLHELIASRRTPSAVYEKKKCESCSLINLCLPNIPAGKAEKYFERSVAAALATTGGPLSE